MLEKTINDIVLSQTPSKAIYKKVQTTTLILAYCPLTRWKNSTTPLLAVAASRAPRRVHIPASKRLHLGVLAALILQRLAQPPQCRVVGRHVVPRVARAGGICVSSRRVRTAVRGPYAVTRMMKPHAFPPLPGDGAAHTAARGRYCGAAAAPLLRFCVMFRLLALLAARCGDVELLRECICVRACEELGYSYSSSSEMYVNENQEIMCAHWCSFTLVLTLLEIRYNFRRLQIRRL